MQDTLSDYELIQKIGAGGMSEVYLARRISDEAIVVVKSLHPQYAQREEIVKRFHQEAALLSLLSHPAIVKLYDFFVEKGIPYLVMEYVAGQSLRAILQVTRAPISWAWTYETFKPILEALGYLHSSGILHRDLKPSNILVLPEGGAKLIDFGIAKILDADLNLTQTGAQVGTVLYMAPEQIRGQAVSPQTDLYAMGLLLYECLFGSYPWSHADRPLYEIYKQILEQPPPLPSWAPARWRDFFRRALAKKPKDRYPSAEAMLAALAALGEATSPPDLSSAPKESFQEAEQPETHTPSPLPQPKRVKLNRMWIIAAGSLLLIGLSLLLWGLLGSSKGSAMAEEDAPIPPPDTTAPVTVKRVPTGASAAPRERYAASAGQKSSAPSPSLPVPTKPSSSSPPAALLEAAIQREMEAFAQRRKSTLNREIQWDPLPPLLSPAAGEIQVGFQETYTKQEKSSEDTFEDCPGGSVRRVTTYYVENFTCTRRAQARIQYRQSTPNEPPQIQIFEAFGSGSENCFPTNRIPKDNKVGECE